MNLTPMRSRRFSIALGLLITAASLLAQDSAPIAQTSDSPSLHGLYPSGFLIARSEKANKSKDHQPPDYDVLQVLAAIRSNWYPQISELQKSTAMTPGTAVIEFDIKRDGSLENLKTIDSSGSTPQDEIARQAVESSAPFAPFPDDYQGKSLKLQMHFGYNQPARAEAPVCEGPNMGAHSAAGVPVYRTGNGIKAPHAKYSPDPEYSEEARRAKYQSAIAVAGTVDANGTFTDICLLQAAGYRLDEEAIQTLRTWKFEPGTLDQKPVAVRITVEMTFRLY